MGEQNRLSWRGRVLLGVCPTPSMRWRHRLAALLTRFPLPRGSAEGEVIASSIAARCWLSERQVTLLAASTPWQNAVVLGKSAMDLRCMWVSWLSTSKQGRDRWDIGLQAAFLTYGAMEPGTASLMAELLVSPASAACVPADW